MHVFAPVQHKYTSYIRFCICVVCVNYLHPMHKCCIHALDMESYKNVLSWCVACESFWQMGGLVPSQHEPLISCYHGKMCELWLLLLTGAPEPWVILILDDGTQQVGLLCGLMRAVENVAAKQILRLLIYPFSALKFIGWRHQIRSSQTEP